MIAGSRKFLDYKTISSILDELYGDEDILIVSGGGRGADKLVEKYANDHKLYMKIFKADWKRRGKLAGMIRNTAMVEFCDEALIFYDGKSPGTSDAIKKLRNEKKPFRVVTKWNRIKTYKKR